MSSSQYTSVHQNEADHGSTNGEQLKHRAPPSESNWRTRLPPLKYLLAMVLPWIVAIAAFTQIQSAPSGLTEQCADLRVQSLSKKRNVYWDESTITREARHQALNQKGATLWFTGLSGSGKSTVGKALERYLIEHHHQVYRLDGDNVRIGLNRDLGFSAHDRQESVRRVGEMSALFTDAGVITVVGLVSPYRKDRDEVRDLHKKMKIPFYEVFVDVPIEVVMARDPKGLYKRAVNGEIKHFTGISDPYEAPLKPEIHLPSANLTVDEEVRLLVDFLEKEGILTGASSVPKGFPGIALPVGGDRTLQKMKARPANVSLEAAVSLYSSDEKKTSDSPVFTEDYIETLPQVLLRDEDLHWVQVISEGWASPLRGFMRESSYLQSLHFQSVVVNDVFFNKTEPHCNSLNLSCPTNFSEYSTDKVSLGKRVNMAVPIVLPIFDIKKKEIKASGAKDVVLISSAGERIAVLSDIEIFNHRKEERITRTFGTVDENHPVIKTIHSSGEHLIGGEIHLLVPRITYNDGLDEFRKTPSELRQRFQELEADVVVAFQTRNPTHAGHAYLMKTACENLKKLGFKNPVLWLSPLGGWTKSDDVPLDVRLRQHEAIIEEGKMLGDVKTVLSVWPSPMIYAGPREVQWHALSRTNAGASAFVVGRDPAGIKHSYFHGEKKEEDVYEGDHGRFVLHVSPGMENDHSMRLMSFSKVYYDIRDGTMKPASEDIPKEKLLSISGSLMRKMAREGLQVCDHKIQDGKAWKADVKCVPQGFMSQKGWNIVVKYYQALAGGSTSDKWIPYAKPFPSKSVDTRLPPINNDVLDGAGVKVVTSGDFGKTNFGLTFMSVNPSTRSTTNISPWHDLPLVNDNWVKKINSQKKVFNFVVEIPKGRMEKMEVNKENSNNPIKQDTNKDGSVRGYKYDVPFFNYGMLPQTWEDPSQKDSNGNGGDNDPIDVMEVGTKARKIGEVVPVVVIGVLQLIDEGEVDTKVIVLPVDEDESSDFYWKKIPDLEALTKSHPEIYERLVDWLLNYKIAEGKGKNLIDNLDGDRSPKLGEKLIWKTNDEWKALIKDMSDEDKQKTGFSLP